MRRARLLHVLASAPAAVLLTAATAPSTAAVVGAASIPPPYVVCIDPGHGGRDPGAIGLDGLVEKNLTLDISDRLAALLRDDGVTVVLTRTTDASVSIQQRSDIANASHADVFLPIYFNAWSTPIPDGSVVLYPYARDIPFAQAISQAVTTYIAPDGDQDGGTVLRDDWWLEPTMPTATVESLFITNPHDAALLTESSFREGLAEALRGGIEAYLPGILQRQRDILVAPPPPAPSTAVRPGSVRSVASPAGAGGPPAVLQALGWLLLIGIILLAVRHRRRLIAVAGSALALGARSFRGSGLRHRVLHRRRRLVRERSVTAGGGEGAGAAPTYRSLFPPFRDSPVRTGQTDQLPLSEDAPLPGLELRGRLAESTRRHIPDELPL
jgi:N-acetylmuramoyl-L-alanine amidase